MLKNYSQSITVFVMLNAVAYILHHFLIIPEIKIESIPVIRLEMSYLINVIISFIVLFTIVFLKKKYEDQIGFIFLGLNVVKMILLFVLLNPTNNTDDVMKIDALAFFVPFALNLVVELIFIVKLLNISDLATELNKK